MYQIDKIIDGSKKTFVFHGSIESTNADEVSSLVFPEIEKIDEVTFDFQDVKYISSAGLRIILKSARSCIDFKIINVCPEVYEIFDMTGFTQIVTVKKAMREISIEGKELIGEGYMGRVYRLNEDTIIKVFYRNSTIEDIEREIGLAKKAFVLGIPTAIPFDVVKVKEGGYGSIFECLSSSCFNKLFIQHPENTDKYITQYIDLLKTMMDIRVIDPSALPSKKKEAWVWLEGCKKENLFEPRVVEKLTQLVGSIPEDNHLIHGDYHIKNIMMQGEEPLLIDMDTLGVGHEIFEITAFFLTYIGYSATVPADADSFLGVPDEVTNRIWNRTINEVFADRTEEERNQIVEKCALLGYMWLAYKTTVFEPENKVRLNHAIKQVNDLVDKYNTLAF